MEIPNHLKNNWGKYLTGAGALGAGYLGNEYLNDNPEIVSNTKHFGKNAWDVWSSDLPLSLKPKLTGVAFDSAMQNYNDGTTPEEAAAHAEFKLPNMGSTDKYLRLNNNFIGVPKDSFSNGYSKDDIISFNQKEYNDKYGEGGFTLGSASGTSNNLQQELAKVDAEIKAQQDSITPEQQEAYDKHQQEIASYPAKVDAEIKAQQDSITPEQQEAYDKHQQEIASNKSDNPSTEPQDTKEQDAQKLKDHYKKMSILQKNATTISELGNISKTQPETSQEFNKGEGMKPWKTLNNFVKNDVKELQDKTDFNSAPQWVQDARIKAHPEQYSRYKG